MKISLSPVTSSTPANVFLIQNSRREENWLLHRGRIAMGIDLCPNSQHANGRTVASRLNLRLVAPTFSRKAFRLIVATAIMVKKENMQVRKVVQNSPISPPSLNHFMENENFLSLSLRPYVRSPKYILTDSKYSRSHAHSFHLKIVTFSLSCKNPF